MHFLSMRFLNPFCKSTPLKIISITQVYDKGHELIKYSIKCNDFSEDKESEIGIDEISKLIEI